MNTFGININDPKYKKRYLHYFRRDITSKILTKTEIRKSRDLVYERRELRDVEIANKIFFDAIKSKVPFSLIRPGNGECSFALEWEEVQFFGRRLYKRRSDNWANHMNLFPDCYDDYNYAFRRDLIDADIFVMFPDFVMEEYLAERYCEKAQWLSLSNFGPITAERPWTEALKGKKVLFVSQFADYLVQQYSKRSKLYSGKWQWPEFELITVNSVWYFPQQKDSRFSSWFDALNYLYEEIMKHDFDIAILSCGAFAINLASMIKRAGKQAIQYGGELQMLFGIRGARWDKNSFFMQYYNDSWIRVAKEDVGIRLDNVKTLDDACYW